MFAPSFFGGNANALYYTGTGLTKVVFWVIGGVSVAVHSAINSVQLREVSKTKIAAPVTQIQPVTKINVFLDVNDTPCTILLRDALLKVGKVVFREAGTWLLFQ